MAGVTFSPAGTRYPQASGYNELYRSPTAGTGGGVTVTGAYSPTQEAMLRLARQRQAAAGEQAPPVLPTPTPPPTKPGEVLRQVPLPPQFPQEFPPYQNWPTSWPSWPDLSSLMAAYAPMTTATSAPTTTASGYPAAPPMQPRPIGPTPTNFRPQDFGGDIYRYVEDALKMGMSLEDIRDFLSRNPGDYHRLVSRGNAPGVGGNVSDAEQQRLNQARPQRPTPTAPAPTPTPTGLDPNRTGSVEEAKAYIQQQVGPMIGGRAITDAEFSDLARTVGYTGGPVTGALVTRAIEEAKRRLAGGR